MSTIPVTPTASVNWRAWASAVLAGRRVEHEQHLGELAGRALGDSAHLAQLLHQVHLRVQPAGGVGEHEVAAPLAAACWTASKITDEGSAPSAPRTIRAPARSAQVSSCSPAAARNVSPAASTTPRPRLHLAQGELADRRRLADAVHPDEEPHRRAFALAERERLVVALEHGREVSLQRLEECGGVGGGQGAVFQFGSEIVEDPCRRRDPDVGEDQRLLELFEGGLVDALAASYALEVAGQQATGPPEPLLERRRGGGLLDRRWGRLRLRRRVGASVGAASGAPAGGRAGVIGGAGGGAPAGGRAGVIGGAGGRAESRALAAAAAVARTDRKRRRVTTARATTTRMMTRVMPCADYRPAAPAQESV